MYEFQRRKLDGKVLLERDVEVGMRGAHAVKSQVYVFFREITEVDGLSLPLSLPRVQHHAPYDRIGTKAVLFDLFQIALQVGGQLVAFGSGTGIIQLVRQLPGNRGEVGDEVERVPDLVRDTGGQLTQRSHLLRLNKLFLGVPQFVQRMVEVLVRFFEFTVGLLLVAESLEQQKTQDEKQGRTRDQHDAQEPVDLPFLAKKVDLGLLSGQVELVLQLRELACTFKIEEGVAQRVILLLHRQRFGGISGPFIRFRQGVRGIHDSGRIAVGGTDLKRGFQVNLGAVRMVFLEKRPADPDQGDRFPVEVGRVLEICQGGPVHVPRTFDLILPEEEVGKARHAFLVSFFVTEFALVFQGKHQIRFGFRVTPEFCST